MKKRLLVAVFALVLVSLWIVPVLAHGGEVHYVQAGETLANIAAQYGVSAGELMALNGLTNPDLIYVGQKLILPDGAQNQPDWDHGHEGNNGPGGHNDGYGYDGNYVVRPGDTLSAIAARLSVSVQALMSANDLFDSDMIYVGQILRTPGPGLTPPPAYGYTPEYGCGYNYMVRPGDSLTGIAWEHGVSIDEIRESNRLDHDMIYSGQSLCLPSVHHSPVASPSSYYTVKPGDTISAIAARFGVPPASIISANNLPGSGLIFVGQKLVIPGCTTPTRPGSKGGPAYVPAGAPDYVDVNDIKDGDVTVVGGYNKWTGSQTADFADPDGNTTMIVRSVGEDNIPVIIRQGGFVMPVTTATSAEFGLASYGFKGLNPGEYEVWVDRDRSDVVKAHLEAGRRILVEFRYSGVSDNPAASTPEGWSGRVTKNTGGTKPADGVWSVIIVNTPAVGMPVSLRAEGSDNVLATCNTGTKPELGPAACDFGGLWPGKYTVTLEGAGIAVQVFVDGQGVAEVLFEKR